MNNLLKQLTNFGGIGLMLFMFGFSWAVVSNHLSTSPICLLAIGGTLIALDVGSKLAKKINNHYTARPIV